MGAKVPGNESSIEHSFPGAKVPGSELAKVLLELSLLGANWPGAKRPGTSADNEFLYKVYIHTASRVASFVGLGFRVRVS